MPKKNFKTLLYFLVLILFLGALLYFVYSRRDPSISSKNDEPLAQSFSAREIPTGLSSNHVNVAIETHGTDDRINVSRLTPLPSENISLTLANFENYVHECFLGQACQLADDPWQMYLSYKNSHNQIAVQNLIAFLRSQLQKGDFKARYQNLVLKMITDFYSLDERKFQEAAYYDYMGEPRKALALYLGLDEKDKTNPKVTTKRTLNIANIYFSLGEFQDARLYYEQALDDLLNNRGQSYANPNEMAAFIRDRLAAIADKHK